MGAAGSRVTAKGVLAGHLGHAAADLSSKVYVVTGGNQGIGFETVAALYKHNATVVLCARGKDRAAQACEQIRDREGTSGAGLCVPAELDLADEASIRRAAQEIAAAYPKIDCLILNAGIMMMPKRELVFDGRAEAHLGVNHFGHFLFTMLLEKPLKAAARPGEPARVVSLASRAHIRTYKGGILFDNLLQDNGAYSPMSSYGQSKFANVLFARELNRRWGPAVTAVSVHPGVIVTNLWQHIPVPLIALKAIGYGLNLVATKNTEQGAATTVYCATAPEIKEHGGEYFNNCAAAEPVGVTDEAAARLFDLSLEFWGIKK